MVAAVGKKKTRQPSTEVDWLKASLRVGQGLSIVQILAVLAVVRRGA